MDRRSSEPAVTEDSLSALAELVVQRAAEVARRESDGRFQQAIEEIPAAFYRTDAQGRLTHFNRAAVEFSGRVPQVGTDHWCVSWKLYNADGIPLPHDRCPMAISLREGREVRGVDAVAERPDGRRIAFRPYPVPLRDGSGRIVGGLNMLVDISRQKSAEAALRRSEEQYRRLVSLMPSAVYTIEAPSARVTFYNERAAQLWGRRPELGEDAERFCGSYRLWWPDGRPLKHEDTPMALAIREGRSFRNIDVVMERPDGSRISALVNIDPIRDAHGNIEGAINVFLDVSALKQAEKDLLRRSAQLAAFLDTATIALHRVAADGTILWANDAELNMLGYSREEYVGQHIARFHADTQNISDILACLTRGERLREREARLRCKDGTVRTVLIDSSVLWEDGKFVHTQCFTRDITETRKAEELRARLAWLVDSSEDAIIGTALDGTIQSWNAGAEHIYGYSAAEALGRPISLLIPEQHRDQEAAAMARLARGERIQHFETERRAKDGRQVYVSLTVSPVRDADGRIVGASKIARDVTERKLAEAERREAERRKDEFLAILSHELRNPLAPLRNAVTILGMAGDDAVVRSQVQGILERQVNQMSRLVDELMDLTRISRGLITPQKVPVDLNEVVTTALETARPLIEEGAHRLQVSLAQRPIIVQADPVRVAQIVANLLNNAAKYTPPGGTVWLTVRDAGDAVQVSVRDTGIGIGADMLPRIFEMFTPSGASHLSGKSGLGIGLSIARTLARLHGGDVIAHSGGSGQGSEFTLRLPRLQAAGAVSPRPEAREVGTAVPALRVLIADDNADAAETTGMLLRKAGHAVRIVHDGEAALRAASDEATDVVLLDLGLPRLDGFAVAGRLRQDERLRGLRIVAVTGHGLEQYRQRCRDSGFDGHLVKPVDPAVLLNALRGPG